MDRKVEDTDPKLLNTLESGDILFIDSSHCVRIGGDVNFLFLDVLPLLNPGMPGWGLRSDASRMAG